MLEPLLALDVLTTGHAIGLSIDLGVLLTLDGLFATSTLDAVLVVQVVSQLDDLISGLERDLASEAELVRRLLWWL